MIHYPGCPVCKSGNIKEALTARDHTVSQSLFSIWKCADCDAMFTQDVPEEDAIGPYYQAENYISHSNSQEGVINKLYHIVRKITLKNKRKLVSRETGLKKGRVLDVGSGTGAFLQTMQEGGWQATGLEPDDKARANAAALFGVHTLPSGELFNLPHNSFDVITLWHVLEHVHRLHHYMEQLKMLLAENGRIFIAVPNYTSYDGSVYKEGWAGYDVPRHLYHFSPRSMNVLAELHGFTITKIKPMWFDSYYVSMLSEKHKKGGMVKAFINGFITSVKTIGDKKQSSSLVYVLRKG